MTLKFGNNLIRHSTYFALHEAVIEQLSLSEGLSSSTRVVLWKITGTLVQVLGEAFLSPGRSDGSSLVERKRWQISSGVIFGWQAWQ